jgi:uncharacterized cupin superfamily protein
MNITRFKDAPEYKAPNHFDMKCLRLQGHEAGPSQALWMGVSQIQPGGHTGLDGSPLEKHYVVLEGEVTLVSEFHGVISEAVLKAHDSACFAPGEKRQLVNKTNSVASILLAMPYPPASK